MKKYRVLVLMHEDLVPPADEVKTLEERLTASWRTEYDVVTTLRAIGHDVKPLGVATDLAVIGNALSEYKPDIAFNLLEEFHGFGAYDQHVVSYLQLMKVPHTGCNPRGLTIARDKALTKKIMAYHRIGAPKFAVFPINRAVKRPKGLEFPLFVKSITEHGSSGISQASVVTDDEKLKERVEFIHRKLGTFAIAEQYIEGRELYIGVIGNRKLQLLPTWEMVFEKMPEDAIRIATDKAKWDVEYQKKWGIKSAAAKDLPPGKDKEIAQLCRRIYRVLGLSGYARLDLRMTPAGELYLLEANPNPQIAIGEDFADSAHAAGIGYEDLLQKILTLGLSYEAEGLA